MPGFIVQVGGVVACFHQGSVSVVPSNQRVLLGVQQALTVSDIPAVAGCPFQVPVPGGTKPQPCVTVQLETATKVLIDNRPALILTPAAVGVSVEQIKQGPPNSAAVQAKVIAT